MLINEVAVQAAALQGRRRRADQDAAWPAIQSVVRTRDAMMAAVRLHLRHRRGYQDRDRRSSRPQRRRCSVQKHAGTDLALRRVLKGELHG
jgi:hypothetical protein